MQNPFDDLPGFDLLRQALNFGQPPQPQPAPVDNARSTKAGGAKGVGGGGSGGSRSSGGGAKTKTTSSSNDKAWDDSPAELGEHNPEPVADPVETKAKATLKKVGWVQDKTQFKSEAEIFAEFTVPASEKHRTLVEFELLLKEKGDFKVVESAKGHADANGRATAKVPIRKPAEAEGKSAAKAIFALKTKHCTADWSKETGTEREVTETAEQGYEHTQVSGIHFTQNKSFIAPQYLKVFRDLESEFKSWRATREYAKIVIYGHAERDEEDPRKLSARRSQAAFAFLIGDYHMWNRIATEERWGLWEQQHMLQALGFYEGKVDGISGPGTKKAIRDFITWLNENECKNLNPLLGLTEEHIRLELYRVYITGAKRTVIMPSSHFRLVSGNPFVGCGAFNRYKGGNASFPENRRATFLLIADSYSFPATFPCRSSSSGPCESETQKPGERAVKGFGCKFYDEVMQKEKVGEGVDEALGTVIKKGDKGYGVLELKIRLAGFGGSIPSDVFDDQTEKQLKQFQLLWMKEKNSSGVLDIETAKAIDNFGAKYQVDLATVKCRCGKCDGFGNGEFKGKYSNGKSTESANKYEYPGIHRSLLWAFKGINFHLESTELKVDKITSGYRCWKDNEEHDRTSTNHMGKAIDFTIASKKGIRGGKTECDTVRSLILKQMKSQIRWSSKNIFSMEPSEKSHPKEYVSPTWVHLDVREFEAKYLEDRFFCKSNQDLEGESMASILNKIAG
jgi:outer membrane protein OmpA-like peptidoglycan-associated protein